MMFFHHIGKNESQMGRSTTKQFSIGGAVPLCLESAFFLKITKSQGPGSADQDVSYVDRFYHSFLGNCTPKLKSDYYNFPHV